jgi:2Fe-2S ferredoxin
MANLTIISRGGEARTVYATSGQSLMEIIRDAGFDEMLAMCGGNCSCATCHVYIEGTTDLPAIGPDEEDLLDSSSFRTRHSRLACQIPFEDILDGLQVRIGPED